jgi:hypothetical protein
MRHGPTIGRGFAIIAALIATACATKSPAARAPAKLLYVWAGPRDGESLAASSAARDSAGRSDFIAVVDADPGSARYGTVIASGSTGLPGMMAHHMELSLPTGHALFASDYMTGQIFLIDVSDPLAPRVTARVDSVPGYRRPHSFARLASGHVLATMQNGNGRAPGDPGGVAEFDADGRLVRTSSASDAQFAGAHIRPNGIELLPAIDRMVTTSMPMDDESTADVVQVWRISDLRLLHTIALPKVAGDTSLHMPYDSRTLPDGHSVMIDTYYCELYRLADIDAEHPRLEPVRLEHVLHSDGCAVSAVMGHYLLLPAASAHDVVSFDVSDPAHPREVSALHLDTLFFPHWISADPTSDRIVVSSSEVGDPRIVIAQLDRNTGVLSRDAAFQEQGAAKPGVSFDHDPWRHAGKAPIAHAAIFGNVR